MRSTMTTRFVVSSPGRGKWTLILGLVWGAATVSGSVLRKRLALSPAFAEYLSVAQQLLLALPVNLAWRVF